MKKLKLLLAAACLALVIHTQAAVIDLVWDYDIVNLTPDISFNVYAADVLPAAFPAGWTLVAHVKQSDQLPPWIPGMSLIFEETVVPGAKFYTVTAVNFWGIESSPSNVVSTPAAVPPTKPKTLQILLKTP